MLPPLGLRASPSRDERTMARYHVNPFIYGKPVPPNRFVGRQSAVRTIFARLSNSESTTIVGLSHSGKSSLLRYIRDEDVRADWLGDSGSYYFVDIDCHLIPPSFEPINFWQEILTQIAEAFPQEEVRTQIEVVQQAGYGSFTLQSLFRLLERHEKRVVLLLDEFDVLLSHPNFNTAEFFGALRSLTTQSNSLTLVAASRVPTADMNRRTQQINPLGSPFFNNLAEADLPVFRPSEVDQLIDQAIAGTSVSFTEEDRAFIIRMAGGNPFLTQMTAAELFDTYVQGLSGERQRAIVTRSVPKLAHSHFEDLWRSLNDAEKRVMLALVLAELAGQMEGQDVDLTRYLEGGDADTSLRYLVGWGLVEKFSEDNRYDDGGYFAIHRASYWRIGAGWMVYWLSQYQSSDILKRLPKSHIPELSSLRMEGSEALPQRFLAQAGFIVRRVDRYGLLCFSDAALWSDISPLYVRLVLHRELNLDEFQALCAAARSAHDRKTGTIIVAVVIDQPPRTSDLYQIFALRAQEGITIVPLAYSQLAQARIDGHIMEALRDQLDLYTGRTNLYDVRTAVSDVLSFYGRSALLAELQRQLTNGHSTIIIGVRKMGKSSLMGRLREESNWPIAIIDLQAYIGNLRHVYDEALRSWYSTISASFSDFTLPKLNPSSNESHAAEAQRFRQTVEDLLGRLADQSGSPGLLLFLDEVDVLASQDEYYDFAAVLRGIAESPRYRRRFALLTVGMDPFINRVDRLKGLRNPFFSFFNEAPLGPLEPNDVRAMIISVGGQMGINYTDEALQLLADAGGGHPFLTRQLCSQSVKGLERPATIDVDRVSQAIEVYLRSARNYLAESLWAIDSGGPPAAETTILQMLATAQPQTEETLIPPE
jgi:hypothetical protein